MGSQFTGRLYGLRFLFWFEVNEDIRDPESRLWIWSPAMYISDQAGVRRNRQDSCRVIYKMSRKCYRIRVFTLIMTVAGVKMVSLPCDGLF